MMMMMMMMMPSEEKLFCGAESEVALHHAE